MPKPRKNQKQIAQRYEGNLRYYNKLHPLRRLRFVLALLCMMAALAAGGVYLWYWYFTPPPDRTADTTKKPDDLGTTRPLEWLNSPGGISQAHSRYAADCAKCHDPALKTNLAQPAVVKASLDAKCEACHNNPPYNFHQTNVVGGLSCADCHHEHLGTGPMQPVADNDCLTCHGNAATMSQSAQVAKSQLAAMMNPSGGANSSSMFVTMHASRQDPHLVYFQPPRPANGYTEVIHSFATDHPDFQIQREHLQDGNTLKFGHKFHLSDQVRKADGQPLTCNDCHKPDSRGAYMQPVSYEQSCKACHLLQMDVAQPNFLIPHPAADDPNSNSVRNFIKDLAPQYENFARQQLSLTRKSDIDKFVASSMKRVQSRIRSGADLEEQVFGSGTSYISYGGAPGEGTADRALFQGCSVCHEVTRSPAGQREVTPPITPDRWFIHARFDHAAHAAVRSCEECHTTVRASDKTADINIPDKASCVKCHSPAGGVVSTCATCHDYHNEAPASLSAGMTPLRQMMLGGALPLVGSSAQH